MLVNLLRYAQLLQSQVMLKHGSLKWCSDHIMVRWWSYILGSPYQELILATQTATITWITTSCTRCLRFEMIFMIFQTQLGLVHSVANCNWIASSHWLKLLDHPTVRLSLRQAGGRLSGGVWGSAALQGKTRYLKWFQTCKIKKTCKTRRDHNKYTNFGKTT